VNETLFRFTQIWHFYCTMSRGSVFYQTQCSYSKKFWSCSRWQY